MAAAVPAADLGAGAEAEPAALDGCAPLEAAPGAAAAADAGAALPVSVPAAGAAEPDGAAELSAGAAGVPGAASVAGVGCPFLRRALRSLPEDRLPHAVAVRAAAASTTPITLQRFTVAVGGYGSPRFWRRMPQSPLLHGAGFGVTFGDCFLSNDW